MLSLDLLVFLLSYITHLAFFFLIYNKTSYTGGSILYILLHSRIVNGRIITTMSNLTDNARKVFIFVSKFQLKNGYSPSIPEIMEATQIKSIRGVSLQLEKL